MSGRIRPNLSIAAAALLAVGLAACESGDVVGDYPERREEGHYGYGKEAPSIFGEGGLTNLFSDDKKPQGEQGGGGIGVNAFLWRASLDTISFMPVNSADPFGGVIITDWHANAEAPSERFKLNVYILGRTLRADGVRVSIFRQVLNRAGQWQDSNVPDGTKVKIEDAILTRARQLRNAAIVLQK